MTDTINKAGPPNPMWKEKAIAFVIRSQRELWGKHNEDPLVWFFQNGFKNQFVKDMLIGWNRHSKLRSAKNWGLDPLYEEAGFQPGKFLLPEGLVIPCIVDKNLKKITIFKHTGSGHNKTHVVPGSCNHSMVLGDEKRVVAVVEDIIDGLYIHQEAEKELCVLIPHNPDEAPDKAAEKVLTNAERIQFFGKPPHNKVDSYKKWVDLHPSSTFFNYSHKDQILDKLDK